MNSLVVKFVKDETIPRKWYIHCVNPSIHSYADTIEDYKWHFEATQATDVIEELSKFNLAAEKEIIHDNNASGDYIISILLETDADEAHFIMMSSANLITLPFDCYC